MSNRSLYIGSAAIGAIATIVVYMARKKHLETKNAKAIPNKNVFELMDGIQNEIDPNSLQAALIEQPIQKSKSNTVTQEVNSNPGINVSEATSPILDQGMIEKNLKKTDFGSGIKKGDTGERVTMFQHWLNAHCKKPEMQIPVTGVYDEKTLRGVKDNYHILFGLSEKASSVMFQEMREQGWIPDDKLEELMNPKKNPNQKRK